MQHIINQAKSPGGIEIDKNIILKVQADKYSYTATFSRGTYDSNEPFLISCGASTSMTLNALRKQIRTVYNPQYGLKSPVKYRFTGPSVVDILLPGVSLDVAAYLYTGDGYNFCLRLGQALLSRDHLKV